MERVPVPVKGSTDEPSSKVNVLLQVLFFLFLLYFALLCGLGLFGFRGLLSKNGKVVFEGLHLQAEARRFCARVGHGLRFSATIFILAPDRKQKINIPLTWPNMF